MRTLARTRLRDDIVHELGALIAGGELDGSRRLKEIELARRLGVSRTPLREALLILERDGLVVSEVNKGFRVASVSEARVRELYPILGSLEALAVRDGIARLRPRAGELRAINAKLRTSRGNARRHALDRGFHQLLWSGSDNASLVAMLRSLWLQAQQFDGASERGMANLDGSVREHAQIVDAIGRGDGDDAARRLEAHWRNGIAVVAGWLRKAAPALLLCALLGAAHADPALVPAACPVPAATGQAIDCFALTVPENRARPAGKTIAIPIVRFRSRSAHPGEPLVALAGGPGTSAIGRTLDGAHDPHLADRDVILFQQRGTRHARPELLCPGYEAANREIFRANLGTTAAVAKQRAAAAECARQLAGVDLDGYDTQAIAADLVDLQRALGMPVDVYAVSYGTRVALEAMRASPASFHAVVLDSVLPPDVRYDELATDSALRALDRVLDQCAIDPACARAYPDLRARWTDALARANRSPPSVTVPSAGAIRWTARNSIEAVYDALSSRAAIASIPKLVDAIARGDLAPAAKILADNAGPSGGSRGQRLSVWCRDEAPVTDLHRASHHPELDGWQTVAFDPEVCRAWPVAPSSPPRTAVTSAVPTLIVAGEYDPNTPPDWGRRALATLANGFFVEVPGESHVAGQGPCASSMIAAFLRDPKRLPDTSCLARAPAIRFVP